MGLLALVGGDEFNAGNEPHDEVLARSTRDGPAFVLATAAARQHPSTAVHNAQRWFHRFGLAVEELPVLRRSEAQSEQVAALAATGRFFYLVGGDPGLVIEVLRGSRVWSAIAEAWRAGAALAGSSAGAMALCEWSLVRDGWPNSRRRRYVEALGPVHGTVVLPHFETFGRTWIPSALAVAPRPDVCLLGIAERTAAVWDEERWRVSGPGSVTLLAGSNEWVFGPGEGIEGLSSPT